MINVLYKLAGTWYIISTNFPMWLKGDKQNPRFNYVLSDDDNSKLIDEVSYEKKGNRKVIAGVDTQDKEYSNKFEWRGNGFMRLIKSNWELALMDLRGEWAVITFEKTLFTPAGADIISRKPTMDEWTMNEIKEQMRMSDKLRSYLDSLVELKRTDS